MCPVAQISLVQLKNMNTFRYEVLKCSNAALFCEHFVNLRCTCFVVVFCIFLLRYFHLTMANMSYWKIFSFTFSLHIAERNIPNSVSNFLPSCLSKFDSLSFTFNFVLSKFSMLSCVFVLNLLRKRQHLFELKLLNSFRCGSFLFAEYLAHDVNYWVSQ